ncbi:hypothetical protein Tco_0179418 [Tanacetum coccineum]
MGKVVVSQMMAALSLVERHSIAPNERMGLGVVVLWMITIGEVGDIVVMENGTWGKCVKTMGRSGDDGE